jgi:predicted permease
VVISALGNLPFLITVATMIVLYYGARGLTTRQRRKAVLAYFRSPIFIALVAGVVLANLAEHNDSFTHSVLDGLRVVAAGNTLMVLLTVGLSVQFHDFKSVVGLAAGVGLVNLVVMPLLMMPPAHAMNLPHWEIEGLALEGAMPGVTLPVVLCAAYGADARLASKLGLTTIAASVFTIPMIFIVVSLL